MVMYIKNSFIVAGVNYILGGIIMINDYEANKQIIRERVTVTEVVRFCAECPHLDSRECYKKPGIEIDELHIIQKWCPFRAREGSE